MKYSIIGFLILVATQVQAGAPIRCTSTGTSCLPLNVQVDLYGKYLAPQQADYDAVRTVIGGLVADMKLAKFTLKGIGIEGGFSVCLEPADSIAYNIMMERLATVTVDSQKTIFETKPVVSCE